jgi:hypothetical protein
MNVKQLKELLAELDDDTLVVLSSDGEGNSHSPLSGWFNGFYKPDTTWYGEVYGSQEDSLLAQKAIVFYPVN